MLLLVPLFVGLPSLTVEITLLTARPQYRKKKTSQSSEFTVGGSHSAEVKINSVFAEPPAMLIPDISSSRSVRDAIQEVKMVQVISSIIGHNVIFSLEVLE